MKHLSNCVAALIPILFVALSGCSGDSDPASPGTTIAEPTTPDNLLSAMESAVASGATSRLEDLFAPDFLLTLTDGDAALNEPPVAEINRAELLTVLSNIASANPVVNVRNEAAPAIHDVAGVSIRTISDGWSAVQSGRYVGGLVALVGAQMTLVRSPDAADLRVNTVWQVAVMPVLPEGDAGGDILYELAGIEEYAPVKSDASTTFGVVIMTYITDPIPVASLSAVYTPAYPYGSVSADATASSDNGDWGELQFRWRFEEGLDWSAWTSSAAQEWEFTIDGTHEISVQVRDRWGQTSEAAASVEAVGIAYPFPGSPEQLMANFQAVYENMDIDGHRQVISTDFVIYLNQDTIDEYSLPREFFDYDEEMLITERMLSGNAITRPNGDIIPGITRIQFNIFQAEAAWAVSPANHRIPNAPWAPFRVDFTIEQGNVGRLNIKGIIEFYLTSEQVEHQGRTQTRYSMIGQVDYTSAGNFEKPTEDASWSDVKALFR